MIKKLLVTICMVGLIQQTEAQTTINTPTVSGTWSLANAPYLIYNDITVPVNTTLTIEPGVEVVFMGHYLMGVEGSIFAVGSPDQHIIFRAEDTTGWEDFTSTAGGWRGLYVGTRNEASLDQPTFAYCVFRDIKALENTAVATSGKELYVNACLFYNNYAAGGIFTWASFGSTIQSKLKFTNNKVYNTYSNTVMTTLATDSITMTHNQFYDNQTEFGAYSNNTLGEDNDMVLLFQHNEFYNNTVNRNAGAVNISAGGHAFVSNNSVHHNHTVLKGALSVQSKTAIVEKNLIVNNTRVQKEGFLCGINDGGAGLHMLGQVTLHDVAGQNVYIVRNNIIANNYSDINGAGIWAQHCKATIVNNTIVNNISDEWGAGVHGWGRHCQINIQNNIIHSNKSLVWTHDTGRFNFNFHTHTLTITDNLIDHAYSNPPAMAQGLAANFYDTTLVLANATAGAGPAYDAVAADFSPVAGSVNVINQGNNNAADFGATDYLNKPRIIDQTIDLGAIEYEAESTRLADVSGVSGLALYPVPAHEVVYLHNPYDKTVNTLQLFNRMGQALNVHWVENEERVEIDLRRLAAGHYFVQLVFSDGHRYTKAFTVK